jgi:hypothetical protein
MVKAHAFEWAFGFGQHENTPPDSGEQENSPVVGSALLVTNLSPTSQGVGDRNISTKSMLSPLSPTSPTKFFVCMRKVLLG